MTAVRAWPVQFAAAVIAEFGAVWILVFAARADHFGRCAAFRDSAPAIGPIRNLKVGPGGGMVDQFGL